MNNSWLRAFSWLRVIKIWVHVGGEVFPGLVVPGDPQTALPPTPGSLLSGEPSAAGVDAAMAITVGWEGGARGLFGTLIPGSTGAVAAAFRLGAAPWKAASYCVGLEAATEPGGPLKAGEKGQQLNVFPVQGSG